MLRGLLAVVLFGGSCAAVRARERPNLCGRVFVLACRGACGACLVACLVCFWRIFVENHCMQTYLDLLCYYYDYSSY